MWWASIDSVIHDLILHLATHLHVAFYEEEEVYQILHVTVSAMDERSKIIVAKALAHRVDEKNSPTFYDRTEQLLSYIDNEIRPERNRYIHDEWTTIGEGGDRGAMRVKRGPQVYREPPRNERAFGIWKVKDYPSLGAVDEFAKNLEFTYQDLVSLDGHLCWLGGTPAQLKEYSQPLPAVWQSLAHRDWRGEGMRPLPPESSRRS